jgi:DNA-binding NtrC family response regulator
MQRDGHKKLQGAGNRELGESNDSYTQNNKAFTILVVESEISFIGVLKDFLKNEEHLILRAKSAAETLDMIHQHYPDLILLDRDIVGTDIIKLLPELLLEHPSAAIIMMATKPSFSEGIEAIKLGAVDYLERPVDIDKLKKAIDDQKMLYNLMQKSLIN